ncbi:6185_t:CDS:2, partial [Dentiscutata erythropus]
TPKALNMTLTHNNATTQMMYNNATITQIYNKTQNEYLDEDKDENNEKCDLLYIFEAEFGEYLQEWVKMLNEEKEADILEDQDDYV